MTQATRIYKHSAAGTDWGALVLGAGLGLTLALQATTLRAGDFRDFYSEVVTVSRLAALVGTYLSIAGIFLVARIPIVERGVGHDRLVTWHRKLGPWSLYLIGAHVFLIVLGFAGQDQIPLYKDGSWVTRLRSGKVGIGDCPDDVRAVWDLCLRAKDLSDGAFDPWALAGGFDPSGLVKGWAADVAADILVAAGVGHVQVNAAGDLALRGGWFDSVAGVVKPWSIGVVNPDDRGEIVKVFEITDGAIATSGTYEPGAHIYDPLNGLIALGAKSATVVGAEGWLCDAMATAVMVGGQDSVKWFGQAELAGYQAFAVNRHEQSAWSI